MLRLFLYLLVYALIFVVVSVIWTFLGCSTEEIAHIVLVKTEITAESIGVFVILVKLTALAVCLVLISVF